MEKAETKTTTPRIFVACLAAYNCGRLHGAWIDGDQPAWDMYDQIAKMLRASPVAGAEEWAIHDYEAFEGVRISEFEALDKVAEIAAFIVEHGALGGALIEYFGSIGEAQEALEERYHGAFASLADYMQELTEDTNLVPERLRYYIDWQAMARDAEIGGDIIAIETAHDEVHVFAGA